jgi:SAM-dependent methyltransferase
MTEQQRQKLTELAHAPIYYDNGDVGIVDVYVPVYADGEVICNRGARKHENQEVRLKHLDVNGKTVIDLGCNTGYISTHCARNGATKVVGIDLRQDLIDICNYIKEIEGLNNTHFEVADKYLYTEALTETFDIGLHMSNFGYERTIDDLNKYSHIAKVWYVEPTNHPHWEEGQWDEARIRQWGQEKLSKFGQVEFLTLTDYQDRGFFRLTINETSNN